MSFINFNFNDYEIINKDIPVKNPDKNIIDFTLAYNRHSKKIYNYVLKMIRDKMVCEDIVQDIFLRLYEKLDQIKNENSIQFWLFKSARNEVYTYFRKKKTHVDEFNVDDIDEIDICDQEKITGYLEQTDLNKIIMTELDRLPIEQKEVFVMKEYGGLSYKEIAFIMETDENLVKSRLYNTRQKLITYLSKQIKN